MKRKCELQQSQQFVSNELAFSLLVREKFKIRAYNERIGAAPNSKFLTLLLKMFLCFQVISCSFKPLMVKPKILQRCLPPFIFGTYQVLCLQLVRSMWLSVALYSFPEGDSDRSC